MREIPIQSAEPLWRQAISGAQILFVAFGALVLRTIGDLLFVFDLEPLWQPLFQGFILLAAVSLGSLQLLKVSNRLDLFK